MSHPFAELPERQFWAPAVGRRDALDISGLWIPAFPILPRHRVVTFGSCFAQHFSRALVGRGWNWTDYEPAPAGLDDEAQKRFNYGIFSARTGNIYSARLLQQWLDWALGGAPVPDVVWEREGRFFDPFRPSIGPDGFDSPDEMRASRELTLEALARAVRDCKVFVFTLGLTECWRDSHGFEYAVCPGTIAGAFDPDRHRFVNQTTRDVVTSMREVISILRVANPRIKVLLTVSPVPLTATASGDHVLVATSRSKSVLRAAADEIKAANRFVDYFPSYEIITAPPFEGRFFAENKRSVRQEGVDHVMAQFFTGQLQLTGKAAPAEPDPRGKVRMTPRGPVTRVKGKSAPAGGKPATRKRKAAAESDDVVCEEVLLSAFAPKPGKSV